MAQREPPHLRVLATFECRTANDLRCMLIGLSLACEAQVRRRLVPPLYTSGVRYAQEEGGDALRPVNRWQTAVETYRLRAGDCEDLACWRVGELRAAGEKASPYIKFVRIGLIHIQVRRANGLIEDPSRRLGMVVR